VIPEKEALSLPPIPCSKLYQSVIWVEFKILLEKAPLSIRVFTSYFMP
jgi:hypothetical protein